MTARLVIATAIPVAVLATASPGTAQSAWVILGGSGNEAAGWHCNSEGDMDVDNSGRATPTVKECAIGAPFPTGAGVDDLQTRAGQAMALAHRGDVQTSWMGAVVGFEGAAGGESVRGWNFAHWSDYITFPSTAVVPAFADISVWVQGDLDARFPISDWASNGYAGVRLEAMLGVSGAGDHEVYNPILETTFLSYTANAGKYYGSPGVSHSVGQMLTLRAPVGASVFGPSVVFAYSLQVEAEVLGWSANGNGSASATVSGARATLSRVEFFDAQGKAITSGVDYAFPGGTVIVPLALTTVPEPGTLALFASGLLLFGTTSVRRRASLRRNPARRSSGQAS